MTLVTVQDNLNSCGGYHLFTNPTIDINFHFRLINIHLLKTCIINLNINGHECHLILKMHKSARYLPSHRIATNFGQQHIVDVASFHSCLIVTSHVCNKILM